MRDGLAELNDHLARFLQQADELLDDWQRFGVDVRARVDGEVTRLGDTVADAVDASMDRGTRRVNDLVRELRADRIRTSRLALAALLAALLSNVLLLFVLFRPSDPVPVPAPVPAAVAGPADAAPAPAPDAAPAPAPDAGVAPATAPAAAPAHVTRPPPLHHRGH